MLNSLMANLITSCGRAFKVVACLGLGCLLGMVFGAVYHHVWIPPLMFALFFGLCCFGIGSSPGLDKKLTERAFWTALGASFVICLVMILILSALANYFRATTDGNSPEMIMWMVAGFSFYFLPGFLHRLIVDAMLSVQPPAAPPVSHERGAKSTTYEEINRELDTDD